MRSVWTIAAALWWSICGSSASAQDDVRDRLRDAISQSIALPEAFQYVTFGPLLDNRIIELRIRFHSDGGVPSVRKDDAMGSYLVNFPRQGLATVPFIEDAMLGCFVESEICSLMSSYLLRLRQIGQPGQMLFFDEVYPTHAETFRALRQQEFWRAAVLGGIESAVLAVDTHEICHITLSHLDERASLSPLQFEGEADGCMLYFFEVTNLSPVGGLAYLMDAVFREEVLGEFTITHPAPHCRSLALADASLRWLEANRTLLEEAEVGSALVGTAALTDSFRSQAAGSSGDCTDYNQAVSVGRRLATALFNENTDLTSDP